MHPSRLRPLVALCVCLTCLVAGARAAQSPDAAGSIAGKVVLDGKPAPGVVVSVVRDFRTSAARYDAQTTTDAAGEFRFGGLAPGSYVVSAHAPAYASARTSSLAAIRGEQVTVGSGESVDGIELSLVRGGVVTGRVTHEDGTPAVEEEVILYEADENGRPRLDVRGNPVQVNVYDSWRMMRTDDRGVYRVFGLAAGWYVVGAGAAADQPQIAAGGRRFRRTYYPQALDIGRAVAVEVTAGGVVSGIDLTLGKRLEQYSVSGRAVLAGTDEPVSGVSFAIEATQNGNMTYSWGAPTQSDAAGRFAVSGLGPGTYRLRPLRESAGTMYGQGVDVTIVDRDVTGVVVELKQGATLTGRLEVEGAAAAPPAGLSLYLAPVWPEGAAPVFRTPQRATPSETGEFTASGLEPGRYRFYVRGQGDAAGFHVMRVEHQSAVDGAVEVPAGGASGVVVVVARAGGTVRGRVLFAKGAEAQVTGGFATLTRPGDQRPAHGVQLDARRSFLIEHVPDGEYELRVAVLVPAGEKASRRVDCEPVRVTISGGSSITVDVEADLTAGEGEQER